MDREQAKIWSRLSKDDLQIIAQVGLAKHYDNLVHFANGGNVEYEATWGWVIAKSPMFSYAVKYRIKPRTHIVNGFEVPAPIEEYTGPRTVYVPHFWYDNWSAEITGAGVIKRLIERRAAFETREAARANSLAMVGIDPSTYKEQEE